MASESSKAAFAKYFNVTPTSSSNKTKSSTKKEKDSKYDHQARKRTFQPSWKIKYPWIDFKEEKMFCTYCLAANKVNTFTTGCCSFRLENITTHNASKDHTFAAKTHENKHKDEQETPAGLALLSLNEANKDNLRRLLRNAHYIAKLGRPYTDFVALHQLDQAKEIVPATSMSYTNDKAAPVFIKAIAEVRRKQLVKSLKGQMYTVMVDEATDSGIVEELIVYIRFCPPSLKPVTEMLAIKSISSRPNSEAIYDLIVSTLKDDAELGDDWAQNLCGFTSDGVSVLQGHKNGVRALLSKDQPQLLSIHCMAHRLELSIKDSVSSVSFQVKVDETLLALYLLYHNSPAMRAELQQIASDKNCKLLLPTRVGGTRWVGHTLRAIKNLLGSYDVIVNHLTLISEGPATNMKAKSTGLLTKLTKYKFVAYLHVLLDILGTLTIFSLQTQAEDSNIGATMHCLQRTQKILSKYLTISGPNLCSFKAKMGNSGQFKGITLSGDQVDYDAVKKQIVGALMTAVEHRLETDKDVLLAIQTLEPSKWIQGYKANDNPEIFGDQEVRHLHQAFSGVLSYCQFDNVCCESEWTQIKESVIVPRLSRKRTFDDKSEELSWQSVLPFLSDKPNLRLLAQLIIAFSASSAMCERGFSRMKHLKSNRRALLGCSNMTHQLRIMLDPTSISDFCPDNALLEFLTGRTRRPGNRSEEHGNQRESTSINHRILTLEDYESESDDSEDYEGD